uniref:ATP-dependent DNA helicase n=1 Tax=Octopus bimaculoides TaxID=37653 RepID=A0A0L8FYQ1_OCTBM
MLLRNLDSPKLCNGTRITIKKMMPRVLEATILTGKASGEVFFIPRFPLISSDMPFEFKRLQFPVKLSFATTINKAQGQSLEVIGVDLAEPVFSNGQLYIGCSRVGNPNHLILYAPESKNKNVVYQIENNQLSINCFIVAHRQSFYPSNHPQIQL